jgi:para-aminobenzoate synthetase component I
VQRNTKNFFVTDTENFKAQMLSWSNQFNICCFLDTHQYKDAHHSYEWLLAADAADHFSPKENILQQLTSFANEHNDWLFGHVGYDLKNEIEILSSFHIDEIGFPAIFLFQPGTVIQFEKDEIIISCLHQEPENIFYEIRSYATEKIPNKRNNIRIKSRISKDEYVQVISKLQQHILRGDCYEINFCMEFFAEDAEIDPLNIYSQLTTVSPNPFSCYYKCNDKYLFCASPERYLKKTGNTIYSQPIKGTAERNSNNDNDDSITKEKLKASTKDKSENVMVVDLVRNDLSKICKDGTVHIEELFGIYTFPQVHQMISTIKGELKNEINFTDILKSTFPMGSMTGAPKKRVMELIEQYEKTKRGIFSGAVGYLTPQKNFDFNVVIRSIMYNATKKYLSYHVGSGITFYSDAESEYEECLLKAKAIEEVLK